MTNEELLTVAVIYLFLAALTAWFASSRGRDPVNWFGVALFLSPLGAFILLVLMGPPKKVSQ